MTNSDAIIAYLSINAIGQFTELPDHFSAFFHQSDVEFHCLANRLQTDPFVVAVDRFALFGGHIHSGEAVNVVGNSAIMAGIGALHHKIR